MLTEFFSPPEVPRGTRVAFFGECSTAAVAEGGSIAYSELSPFRTHAIAVNRVKIYGNSLAILRHRVAGCCVPQSSDDVADGRGSKRDKNQKQNKNNSSENATSPACSPLTP